MNSQPSAPSMPLPRPIGWVVLSLLLGLTGVGLFYLNQQTAVPPSWATAGGPRNNPAAWINTLQAALILPGAASALGLLILRRGVASRIGWLFITLGVISAGQLFLSEYAVAGAYTQPAPLPGTGLAALITNFAWIFLYALVIYMLAVFPNGRFLSSGFRSVLLLLLALFVLPLFVASLIETPLSSAYQINNPFVTSHPEALYDLLFFIGVPAMPLATVGMVGSVLWRFRRSQGRERQQMKWLLFGVVLQAVLVLLGLVLTIGLNLSFGGILVNASILAAITGIGVALLRHRLYDIDVIIRRTLLYTAVSLTLALTYFGTILLLQTGFRSIVGDQSPVLIVISTLFTVILFNPVRRRLQAIIDRRFYRNKYDAQQVLARFAQTARDEVEMDVLQDELVQVVQETLQPEQIYVWIKPGTRFS